MKRKTKHPVIKALLALIIILAAITVDSNVRIVTECFTVRSAALPEGFEGFKIAQLSDLHGAGFGKNGSRLVKKLKAASPDIIAITGDMVDSDTDMETVDALLSELGTIAPVYYVSGNHEWASGRLPELELLLEKHGAVYLHNEYELLSRNGDSMVLVGVEDPNGFRDMPKPDEVVDALRTEQGEKYTVLLGHRNNWAELYPELEVDLILCGHAHGGIIRLPFVGGVLGAGFNLFPDYVDGCFSVGRYELIVSRGLGNSIPIPRFLNNPEIVIVTLQAEK